MSKIVNLFLDNLDSIIRFSISYLPTILFILIILVGIIKGAIRGFKKTSVYLLHSIICATICLILFFIFVNSKKVDRTILTITNNILGKNRMQEIMDVSTECKSFREIFVEYIPKQMDFFDGLSLIIKDNGHYLETLVDVAYRLTFGIALYFVYLILRLILFIIYNVFFLERKYRNKRDILYEEGYVDTPYRKSRVKGGALGGTIGLFKGILVLSFFGTFLFIFAGGIGNRSKQEVDFEDEDYNLIYDAYSEIGSYGSSGIYKVLNAFRDEKDVPYYLFATNLIFKGNLSDSAHDINGNVYLTDEIAAYVDFSRSTMALFIKYDRENLVKLVNQDENTDVLDEIIKVFQNKDFQKEFKDLITSFESKTYFINLTLSLVDSMCSHFEELEFSKDYANDSLIPLRILFEEGYLCPTIPSEKELIDNNEKKTLGYIKPSQLLTKDDFYNVLDIFYNFIDNFYDYKVDSNGVISIIRNSIENVSNLSILSTDRKHEIDPVLKRLYLYYENEYLGGESEFVNNTITIDKMNVSWVDEVKALVDYVSCGLNIYDGANLRLNPEGSEDKITVTAVDIVNEMFNEEYEEDLNNLIVSLSSSKLLGYVLSNDKVVDSIYIGLDQISKDADFPVGISIGDVYDLNGNFVRYGELHYLLKAINLLSNNTRAKNAFLGILLGNDEYKIVENHNLKKANGEINTDDLVALLSNLVDDNNNSLIESLINSRLISSIISNSLITYSNNLDVDFRLIIDDSIYDLDSNGYKLRIINNSELQKLFKNSGLVIDILESKKPIIDIIKDILLDDKYDLDLIVDSKIIEGSVSNYIYTNLESFENLIIPQSIKNSTILISDDNNISEFKKLVLASKIDGFDIILDNDADDDTIINFIKNRTYEDINVLLNSEILYYSISNILAKFSEDDKAISGISLVIPNVCREENLDDIILINKDTLTNLLFNIKYIVPNKNNSTDEILDNICLHISVLDNIIINSTAAYFLYDNKDELLNGMSIPDDLDNLNSNQKEEYTDRNPWYTEISSVCNAINYILRNDDNTIEREDPTGKILRDIKTYNYKDNGISKLDRLYSSKIFRNNVSLELDKILKADNGIDNQLVNDGDIENAKNGDYYIKSEIAALINFLVMYDIDISDENSVKNLPKEIENDIRNDFGTLKGNFYDEDLNPYLYFVTDNYSKIDLFYLSSIAKASLTKELFNELEVDSNNKKLLVDQNGYFSKDELETLVVISHDNNIDVSSINNILLSSIIDYVDDNIDALTKTDILSILLYDKINNAELDIDDNNGVAIPTKAKMYYNGLYYNALKKEEIKALSYCLRNNIGIKVRTRIDFSGKTIDDFEINEEINYNEIDIDLIGKSYLISSLLYDKVIKKKLNDFEISSALETDRYNADIQYIEINEFKALLEFEYVYADGNEFTYPTSEKDIYIKYKTDDTTYRLSDCINSKIISIIIYDYLINLMDDIPNIFGRLSKQNEMINTERAMSALGINSFDSLEELDFEDEDIRNNIFENIDVIYNSYIVSHYISNAVRDVLPPYIPINGELVDLEKKYDKNNGRYKKDLLIDIIENYNYLIEYL